MFSYPKAAMERAMKVQEVILRAMAKKITWYQAAEILGISDRHMRRWRERYGVVPGAHGPLTLSDPKNWLRIATWSGSPAVFLYVSQNRLKVTKELGIM